MEIINWGIIGCGDVTELKSGPAFQKVPHSALVAVMRRDEAKARDYATRHAVPRYYTSAADLINDPQVNAVYVATPPDTHETYTIAALAAGKPVYVEKPMSLHQQGALNMLTFAREQGVKLSIAHYRREQPYFRKAKELLDSGAIGTLMNVVLKFYQPSLSAAELQHPKNLWRLDPAQSGGGLFHDLAPHQLDILLYFFGNPVAARGFSCNHGRVTLADDTVTGIILFNNNIHFTGSWCFNVPEGEEADECVFIGSKGSIKLSIFKQQQIVLTINGVKELIDFAPLQHVQQPMIEAVVAYFLDRAENPCPAEQGYEVIKLMDSFTSTSHQKI